MAMKLLSNYLKRSIWWSLILTNSAIVLYFFTPLLTSSGNFGDPGTTDFIEYWSAYQILSDGINPYVPANQFVRQFELGRTGEPMMMWNPPWIFTIMAPVLSLSFDKAAQTWIWINTALFMLSLLLAWLACGKVPRHISRLIICTLIPFAPFYELVKVGQVGGLFALSFGLCLFASARGFFILSGISLALLTLKPHLFYLVFICLLLWSVREKNIKVAIGFAIGMLALVAPIYLFHPESLNWWLSAMRMPQEHQGATDVRSWIGPSLVGALRAYAHGSTTSYWAYQSRWIIPLSATVIIGFWMIRQKVARRISDWLPLIVPLSLITAPFGWNFDQVATAPGLLVIIMTSSQQLSDNRNDSKANPHIGFLILISILTILNFFTLKSLGTLIRFQHEFFWYLPTYLLATLGYRYRSSPKEGY